MNIIAECESPSQRDTSRVVATTPFDTRSERCVIGRPIGSLPDKYDPTSARKRDSEADAVIAHAKRVKDWRLLQKAIYQKVADQAEFVNWWDRNVTPNRMPDRNNRPVISTRDAEKLTGVTPMQVCRWRTRLADPEKYRLFLYGVTWAAAMAKHKDGVPATWTGDHEWYTPAPYVEAARAAMGGIDLDPASNEFAQKTVKAARWYGEEANGLLQEWEGRVFLNPPYSYPTVAQFTEKLCIGVESANITAAILLVNNSTDTGWWHRAAQLASAICFTEGRISFYKIDGAKNQPTNGQNFFYFGNERQQFYQHFSAFGHILWPSDEEAL